MSVGSKGVRGPWSWVPPPCPACLSVELTSPTGMAPITVQVQGPRTPVEPTDTRACAHGAPIQLTKMAVTRLSRLPHAVVRPIQLLAHVLVGGIQWTQHCCLPYWLASVSVRGATAVGGEKAKTGQPGFCDCLGCVFWVVWGYCPSL